MLVLKEMVGSPQHKGRNNMSVRIPQAELMTFNGDPLEFWMFMSSFDNSIGSVAIDDSDKLNKLFQYYKGDALKVIKCCAVMSPSAGYVKARALLKERFGDGYKISEMWVKKVTEGPVVRHSEGRCLLELADDLRSCKKTLEAMNKLDEIFFFKKSTHTTYTTMTTILRHYLQNHSTLIKPYNLFLTTTTNNTGLNILYTLHLF